MVLAERQALADGDGHLVAYHLGLDEDRPCRGGPEANAKGDPCLCAGEMLAAIISLLPGRGGPVVPAEAIQVLKRLGVDRSTALGPVLEQVRRSPADERSPWAQPPPYARSDRARS